MTAVDTGLTAWDGMTHVQRGLDKTTHPQVHSFRQYNTPKSHRGRWHNLTGDRLSKQQWVGDWV